MKTALLLLVWAMASWAGFAQSAGLSLVSFSVAMQPSTAKDPLTGLLWNLSFSSSGSTQNPNGELGPAEAGVPYSHQSNFILVDPTTEEPIVLPMAVDAPDAGDSNGNGLSDFFDASIAIQNLQTTGRHPTLDGKGTDFTARWTRPAGQMSGTVVIDLPYFGLKFSTPFSIPAYEGVFNYSFTPPGLPGLVLLTNINEASDQISGPLVLTITNAAQLGYGPGTWTNLTGDQYAFSPVDSLDQADTNYIAFIQFADGNPRTADTDYPLWFLVVHSSDQDGDGTLDLVEPPPASNSPRLEIVRTGQGIQLKIFGDAGRSYILDSRPGFGSSTWTAGQTIPLTGSSQTVDLPSADAARFFRLRQAPN